MNKFTPYALAALPTSNIDVNGIYFIKASSGAKFKIYIRKNDNSSWVDLGVTDQVRSVNGFTDENVQLNLSFLNGVLSLSGSADTINLDARYTKISDNIAWSRITGRPTTLVGYGITDAARDADVVKKAGAAQTVSSAITFTASPKVPLGAGAADAIRKSQLDDTASDLQVQINNLSSAVTDGMRVPTDLNCSTSPNYPASERGDGYVVTHAGKIGGASGIVVRVGAEIRCKTTTAGGTHATVGSNFYILESDLDQATQSVVGFAKIATQALANAGTNDTDFITPKKLHPVVDSKLQDFATDLDGKFVKFVAQTLDASQKTQARNNIGAADDAAVVKKAGTAQSVSSAITFTVSPKVPNATGNTDALNLGGMNSVTEGKFVRFDIGNQGLTEARKGNARANIDAASVSDVSWAAKEW